MTPRIATFAFLALALQSGVAHGQQYPDHTINLVLPVGAGSGSDVFGRVLAEGLSRLWDVPVVVDNVPGSGAAIGTSQVVNAAPDGYTLMFTSNNFATSAVVQAAVPYDPVEDLQPVAMVATAPMLIVAGSHLANSTIDDIVKLVGTRNVFYGDTGTGSPGQFVMELLNMEAGINTTAVHYSSGPDAVIDLAAGRLDLYNSSVSTLLPALESGAWPVALVGTSRSTLLPDVPTMGEAGLPSVLLEPWYGFYAPRGLPEDVVAKINQDVTRVLENPEVVEFMANQQFVAAPTSVQGFEEHVAAQVEIMRRIAREAGLMTP